MDARCTYRWNTDCKRESALSSHINALRSIRLTNVILCQQASYATTSVYGFDRPLCCAKPLIRCWAKMRPYSKRVRGGATWIP